MLTLLLRLMQLSRSADNRLVVCAPDAMLGDLFGDDFAAGSIPEIAAALRRADPADDAATLRAVLDARARMGNLPAGIAASIARYTGVADRLIALRAALGAPQGGATPGPPLHLDIGDMDVLRFVQRLVIDRYGDKLVVVVGGPTTPGPRPIDLTVDVPGDHPVLERTEIAYGLGSPSPRVRVNLPARWSGSGHEALQARQTWIQHPIIECDLHIFNYRSRPLGQILTRTLPLPYTVSGRSLRLTFVAGAPLSVTSTQLRDSKENLLAEIIRVVGAQEPASYQVAHDTSA